MFRVLVAYVVIGFGVAEAAGIFFPALGFPGWTVNLVALLVLLGLPVSLGLAWAFDVVPDSGQGGDSAAKKPYREQVEDLFVSVLAVPEANRVALLESKGGGNEALLADVRSMLAAHDRQGPLDEPREGIVAPLMDQVHPPTEMKGRRILHYDLQDRLGGGGMGVVYKARDTRLDRIVALKFLSAHLLSNEEAKERFLVEAQAAAALDHPNVCTVHEVGETEDGDLYIAMAYYAGETLRQRIEREPISIAEALQIAVQTTRGLARAAENGIIHRDIKPANLMLTEDGTVKVVDFGLAKMTGGGLTQTGTRMGTVAYMSPEQTRGDPVDQRTDVWSVGVVLFEMLTGKRPFVGGSDQAVIHAVLNLDPAVAQTSGAAVPVGVVSLVKRALQKDADQRYPDAASLLVDLERLLDDPSSRSPHDSVPSLPPEGERRRVTVLSCSISGFETLLDRLPADAAEQELSDLRERLQHVVEEFGGVLNEFSEDKAIALFGVPVTHEDDALRAVRAALELREPQPDSPQTEGIELRSAVGSGQVAIRAMSTGERRYRVGGTIGRDVYRLASSAAAGEVLVFPELARAVAPFVVSERKDEIRLSSDTPPIRPLAVLRESGSESRLDASAPGSLTRFVGRDTELQHLIRALEGAQSGSGHVVSVVGDAGVGKSRLLHEFRSILTRDGVCYVQGRCQAQARLTPFVPFIECVKAILDVGRAAPELAEDEVVKRTRALHPELEVYLPVLLQVLSIESSEFPVPDYLAGENLRAAVGEALVSMFTLGSRGQPLVVILEDWHWTDGGSNDVLEQLAEMVSAYPLLLVVTARPEQKGQHAPLQGDVRLELSPLDATSAAEVTRACLNGARAADAVTEKIAEKTGGNPFFIEELCHTLLETGAIVISDGEARLTGSVDRLAIPDTVQAVLKARLERLDPEAREVLRSASVIGRQFGLGLLSRVVPSASRLAGSLDGLRTSGLIQRISLLPEPTYRFKHALTLDVTYDSLLERQRIERHGLVGQAIETLHEGHLDEFSDRLADHFGIAEDWDRAVRYGFLAAERAAGLWRLDEAVAILERTRTWLGRQDRDEEAQNRDLAQLLFLMERHLETLGRRDQQQTVIDDLFTLLDNEHSSDLAQTYVRQGELHTLMGRVTEARVALKKSMKISTEVGALDIRTMALRAVGHDLWQRAQYDRAVAPLTEVVEWDRDGAPTLVLLRDLINLGRVLREKGEWERAIEIGEEARELAESSANAVDLVYARNYMGHLLRAMGRREEALEHFLEGDRVATQARLPIAGAFNKLATAALYMERGEIDESLREYEDAIRVAKRPNRPDIMAHALSLYADALMTLGRSEEAVPHFDQAVGILRRVDKNQALSEIMRKQAIAHEAAGRPEARTTWRELYVLRLSLGDRPGALEALEHEAALTTRDPAASRVLYRAALELAEALGHPASGARSLNSLAILDWRESNFEEAVANYEGAVASLKSADVTEGLGVVLNGLGAALNRLGRHETSLEVLQEALAANQADGDSGREADSLSALGATSRAVGDLTRAYDWYQLCVEKREEAGDRSGEAWALHRLSELAQEAGDGDRAETYGARALAIAQSVGDSELVTRCRTANSRT